MRKQIIATKRTGDTHHSISDYKFQEDSTKSTEWKTKSSGVSYVRAYGNTKVSGGGSEASVYVHDNPDGSDYLQTKADGKWSDNLLAQPVEK